MKKLSLALLALAAAAVAPAVNAQAAGDLVVRARAVYIDPADKDTIPGAEVSVSTKTIPEVDFTYFVAQNVALELILTYPQKHDVKINGAKAGTLKHLPPTLTAQYHFAGMGAFKPYVGAGLNYTRFSNVELGGLEVDKNSFGLAVQAGLDFALDKKLSLNVDVKKVQIRTDVSAGGATLGTVKVDPWLFGVGVGYKF
ncbi:OmpW/AlkL family protein [Sphaerotilus microaerophilus]|uniref:Outer membrane protein n=1 Tax=Sphaerotilus microaerophilus TaxID=2914710 RepID=A0ABM7YHW2_9BURK|nr:OmpW family outer membrane protein [Sphaerotilus sp. FB-5]BDI03780.1 outer membrane protein [Sphaerotilus sp. FB-5]